MRRYIILGALIVSAIIATIGGYAATTGTGPPPTPVNLEVVNATEDSVTIAWGPSPPGPFLDATVGKKNTLTIGWGPSDDTRGPITYTLKRDGTVVATDLTTNAYTLTGVGPKVNSIRVCVTAFNGKGQASTESCGSYTRL